MSNTNESHSPNGSTRWNICGASVAGASHVARKEPRQDRFDYRSLLEDETGRELLMIVCADGAGSAGRSWAGAWRACREVTGRGLARTNLNYRPSEAGYWTDAMMMSLFERAHRGIKHWGRMLNVEPEAMATTLNIAVLGDDFGCFGQVGDGVTGYCMAKGESSWAVAHEPDQGEFAGETNFVTQADWARHVRIRRLTGGVERVFVSTDGLLPILLDLAEGAVHGPFIEPIFQVISRDDVADGAKREGLARFLRSDRVGCRCSDDLTLVLASRQRGLVDEMG